MDRSIGCYFFSKHKKLSVIDMNTKLPKPSFLELFVETQ
jgi:hypothetical protein